VALQRSSIFPKGKNPKKLLCPGEAESQAVVPEVRGVTAAIRCAAAPDIVVPAAATIDPVRAR